MKKLITFLIIVTIQVNTNFAQLEGNIWYFGDKAGLDFNAGNPVPLTNSQMNAFEGCATISDDNGSLLFYTDGINVWDKTHQLMPNGYGLLGNPSASQSGVIVPMPDNSHIYYIFSVPSFASNGFFYSVVDLSQNGGLGDVTQKNINLLPIVSEKVTAVTHQNNLDIWVITHGMDNKYYAYLLTASGLNVVPVESVGVTDLGSSGCKNAQGYLKASPDGKKLAMAVSSCGYYFEGLFELSLFNNLTGTVTSILTDDFIGAYGVEFSPNSKMLYMSGWYNTESLFQYNLDAGTPTDILNSKMLVAQNMVSTSGFGALQIGPDQKIYVGIQDHDYLCVIHSPNLLAPACNYEQNALYLDGRQCRLGLPTFIQSFFNVDFNVINVCYNDTAWFNVPDSISYDSLLWCFGDSLSGNNYSINAHSYHIYSNQGYYDVNLIIYLDGDSITSQQLIAISGLPSVFLGNDTILCSSEQYYVEPEFVGAVGFLWNTGDTTSSILIHNEGTYWLESANECGTTTDSLMVTYLYPPEVTLPSDTTLCEEGSITLNAYFYNATYQWNNGSFNSNILVDTSGTYSVTVNNQCGNTFQSANVSILLVPEIDLGVDTVVCEGETVHIELGSYDNDVVWSTGDSLSYADLTDNGFYYVTVSNKCGFASDTIIIRHDREPVTPDWIDTSICYGETLLLDVYNPRSKYSWSDGSRKSKFEINESGGYFVYINNTCGLFKKNISVDFIYCELDIPNIVTPNKDGQNECFYIRGIEHKKWELNIFNRWGNKIYHSEDYNNEWMVDNIVPGVYYYILDTTESDNTYNGFFHVMK